MKIFSKIFRSFEHQSYRVFIIVHLFAGLLLLFVAPAYSQGKLTGFVVDDEFNEPLVKAVVTIPGTLISVLTDQQGKYVLKMMAGDYFMEVNCPGYYRKQYNMSVTDEITTPMFIIKLKAKEVDRKIQRRITSREDRHQFPQSIEDFSSWKVAEQTGNQEFNQELRTIPSVNFLSNGNGFNDSEVGFRGNDAAHTTYTFDGILLNNPETGRVSSSLLSTLTDRAGNIQVTSGQAANMQSQIGSGGLINVLSSLPHDKAGADLLAIYGNEGFLKTSATVYSGESKKGLASSLQISRTAGDGLAQNTAFEQYGFFLNIRKELNHFHTFVLSLNGVLQQYDRNFSDSIGAYNRFGTKYNQNWGKLNDKPKSWSTNFGRSPLISLTHFWQPRIKTHVSTQIFAQFNRTAQLVPGGTLFNDIPRDSLGQVLYPEITDSNSGQGIIETSSIQFPAINSNSIQTESSGFSTLAAIDSENRFGMRSVLNHQYSKKLDFSIGFNLEHYQASHFGSIYDLLGANGYTSFSDVNRRDGFAVENLFKSKFFPDYQSADKTAYYYESAVQTGGVSFRLYYEFSRYFWYFEGSGSMQNIRRTDHFNYLETDPERYSESLLLPGGRAQTGIRMNLWKYHSIHFRTSYGSYQPLFTTLFPSGNNWKNDAAKNERVLDAEFGYTIFSRKLKIEALVYRTQINNRSMIRYSNLNPEDSFGLVNGLIEIHQGVELKSSYKITRNIQLNLNGSYGRWKYNQDSKALIYDSENELTATNDLGIKNVKIANAPQLSLYSELEYRWAHNFYVRLNYYRAEQIYAPFGLYDFKDLASRSDFKQWQIPKYDLIGFSGNYLLNIRKAFSINLIFGGKNLLDSEYIEQSFTNIPEGNSGYTSNQVYYGMGRTWFAGLKIQF